MNAYMQRALELATLGRGRVSPNPMVGCVIVYDDPVTGPRILGEGWHERYGEAHAERNAVLAVADADRSLLGQATAYVTLEPCAHYGKQPPCADLLVEVGIGRVVCCNDDPNPLVGGQGFARLRAAGIPVETGVLAEQGRDLNARFFTMIEQNRPYIVLKWAESADGFIAGRGGQPVQISGPLSQRLVHRWRVEEDAILVGANTAAADNPRLNVRLWPMADPALRHPTRLVLDPSLRLPTTLHLFDGSVPTLVYHRADLTPPDSRPNLTYAAASDLPALLADLQQRRIQSVLVEGGAQVIGAFVAAGLWDEMRVFRAPVVLGDGVPAPRVAGQLLHREAVGLDELSIYRSR